MWNNYPVCKYLYEVIMAGLENSDQKYITVLIYNLISCERKPWPQRIKVVGHVYQSTRPSLPSKISRCRHHGKQLVLSVRIINKTTPLCRKTSAKNAIGMCFLAY